MKKFPITQKKMQKFNNTKNKKEYAYLPMDPSQKTKKEPSLLRDKPFGNWRFLRRTVVSFVFGLYFRSLPLSSAEKTNCMKFLHKITSLDEMHGASH